MSIHIICDKMAKLSLVKKVQTHVLLDPILDKMLTEEALKERRTKTELIEEALRLYFSQKQKTEEEKVVA